jgi:dolichyl-phosphate-mannose-protein mannosyltransferase
MSECKGGRQPVKINFDFDLNINKKDIITIVLLSIIFFAIAVSNVGAMQVPQNSVTINDNTTTEGAIVDFGNPTYIYKLYFYMKDCQSTSVINVYTGETGNWTKVGTISAGYPYAYMNWNSTNIYATTRYIKLEVEPGAKIEINEIAALDTDNQKVAITSVTGENSTSIDFSRLADEQSLVQLPNTYYTETMFDEVYFARTSAQYLHLQSPYEWTHPPLGKLINAVGIAIFGLNPFGWRIMAVIFGMLMIPLIYLLGKKMFGSWIGGFSAAFLLTFDFMHFTEARLGQVDTYVAFFALASQLFFFIYLSGVVKKGWKNTSIIPLFLSFLFFTFGFASKWLVLFGFLGEIAILAVMRLAEVARNKNKLSAKFYDFFDHPYSYMVGFLLMAIGIYFAIYIPDMLAGRSFMDVIGLQGSMYNYHSQPIGLDHPYASPGWSWPIMGKPLWVYISTWGDMRSSLSLFGNPAVWWVGFAAIIGVTVAVLGKTLYGIFRYIFYRFIKNAVVDSALKKYQLPKLELPAVFLTVVFFAQWLPYAFVSRGLFIYHYYINVPIICLASAYFISKYWKYKWMKIAALVYFIAVVALFVLFYPVISGTPVLTTTSESLRWFKQWVF